MNDSLIRLWSNGIVYDSIDQLLMTFEQHIEVARGEFDLVDAQQPEMSN